MPTPRPTPLKLCPKIECLTPQPTGRSTCVRCGQSFYNRRRMTSSSAIKILMVAAARDIREADPLTDDGAELYEAWATAHRLVYHHQPQPSDFVIAGLKPPTK